MRPDANAGRLIAYGAQVAFFVNVSSDYTPLMESAPGDSTPRRFRGTAAMLFRRSAWARRSGSPLDYCVGARRELEFCVAAGGYGLGHVLGSDLFWGIEAVYGF